MFWTRERGSQVSTTIRQHSVQRNKPWEALLWLLSSSPHIEPLTLQRLASLQAIM